MCLSCVPVCVPAHTNTHILTTTHRGESLELGTINVCIVAYSLCLTGHTTSALLLSPVHCLLHHLPRAHTRCGRRGSVHSCSASENLHRVSVCFLLLILTMLKPFLECQRVSWTTAGFYVRCLHLYKVLINCSSESLPALYSQHLVGRAAFSFIY